MVYVAQNVHAACLRERDIALCKLWCDEIIEFVGELVKACGDPVGSRAIVFRCENEIYVRAQKHYIEKCRMFYAGWIASNPSRRCEVDLPCS